jgi:hypothetical protein
MDMEAWIDVIDLKNYSSRMFKAAASSFRNEPLPLFRIPDPPTISDQYLAAYWKERSRSVVNAAEEYGKACSEAILLLMSKAYMSDDVRQRVMENALFTKVEANQCPTADECRHCFIAPIERCLDESIINEFNEEAGDLDALESDSEVEFRTQKNLLGDLESDDDM